MNGISLFYQIASGDYGLITNERCYFYSPQTDAVTTNNVKMPTEVSFKQL